MQEVQDDIMFEQMDFGEDPKPKLKDSDRRRLDSIVVKMYEGGASEDEIKAIVEDFKSKYAAKPLVAPSKQVPQQQEVEPGREMAGVFGGQKIQPVAAMTGAAQGEMPKATREMIKENKIIPQLKKAEAKIVEEIKGNDDVIEKYMRQRRFENAAIAQPFPTSDMPQTASALAAQMATPQETRPQDVPVTPEELVAAKTDIEQDEVMSRGLLDEIVKNKPEKKKDIYKSVYVVDAMNRVRQSSDKEKILDKVKDNSEKLAKGELIYNVKTGMLVKPEGVVASAITGWKAKSKGYDDFSFLTSKTPQEIIDEYERRRAEYDPDEPIPVPKHKVSEVTQMLGAMPLKSVAAGALVSMAGAPEAAPFASGAVGAADFYRLGYANTFANVYNQLRDEGKTPEESVKAAIAQAQKEATVDAAVGGLMSFGGMRFGTRPIKFSTGYKGAVTGLIKEGGLQSVIGAGGEVAKNKLAQAAGIKRDTGTNVLEAIEGNFWMTVGLGALAKLGSGIPKIKYRTILNGLKKVDDATIENHIATELQAGRMTEQQASNIRSELQSYKELDAQIPENVTEDARLQIQKKIERRAELEGQLETLNKAFHPEVKEKIAKIDEEVAELSKQREPREKQEPKVKEAKLLIDDAVNEGVMSDVYAAMAKQDPEGFMKFVADQSFGRTEEGVVHEAGGAEGQMREQFGDAVVDHAKEMFPLEEKKSSISVVMPEDVKKPDVVEVKATETQPTVDDSGVPPVIEGSAKIHVERPGVELSHSGLQDVANEFSLPDVQSRERVSDIQLRKDAEIQAKEWADKGEYAANIERLTQEAEIGKVLTDKERLIMEQHLANVMGEARAITDKTSPEYAAKFAEISRLKKAGEKTRSAAGAALRISGQRSTPTDAPEDMIIAKEEAIGRPTNPEEKEKTNQQFEKIDKAKKSFSAKGKQIADRIRALRPKTDSAQSQLFGLAVGVYDTALVTIANAIEAGANLADAIQAGILYIKQEGGFKNKKDEKTFAAYIKGQLVYDEKLQAFKARTKSSTEKLKQKTAEKDFEPDVRPILELDEEARQLKNEYRQAKYEFELELQKDKLRQRPFHKKAIDALLEPLRSVRTILTSFDFSAPLRQGIVPTISHPTVAAKAFPEMFKQAFSKTRFDEWLSDLKESPVYDVMDKSGLYIADPNSLHLSAKEENFMSNLAEKIPIVGTLVKGSERAYVSYLNKMRADLFKQGIEVFMQEGKTIQNSPELYEGLANFINNSTGRGKLGPLEGSADFLNTVFFSPRLMASRMNMLGLTDVFTAGQKGFYSQLPKEVRVMAMKDMLKFIGFGTSVLALSKLAGAEVEDDPRSTDFGKIKIGNTRYDIWGGFQGYVRLIAQMASGKTKTTTTGEVKELKPEKRFGERPITFFRGKLAPIPGSVVDLMMGKNVIGEPVTLQGEALESITPMIYRDVKEAMEDQGVKAIFSVGVPAAFGISTNTYEGKSPSSGRGERGKRGQRGTRATRN